VASAAGRWLGEFYITNLADKNAIIYSNTGNFDLCQTTNEPREFGLRLSRWATVLHRVCARPSVWFGNPAWGL
jgi:hypothetical protein